MKISKILSLFLTVPMAIGVLAGCGSSTSMQTQSPSSSPTGSAAAQKTEEELRLEKLSAPGEFPVTTEDITLTVMGAKGGSQGEWAEMKLFKVWSELTGIKLEFTTAPKDNWDEKKNLAFASGNLPDFFFAGYLSENDEMNFGKQGLLIPLGDLIETHAPNLTALFEKDETIKKSITTPDGNIYATPYIDDMERNLTQKYWINKVWMDQLGLSVPTTTDELYQVLKAFKERDPNGNNKADEIPASWTENGFRKTLSWWGLNVNSDTYLGNHDGKVFYAPIEAAYKDYLIYYNKLFTEKLIDSEAFTQPTSQLKAKGKEDTLILGSFFEAGPFVVVNNEYNEDYIALSPLKAPDGTQEWTKQSGIKRGTFAITKDNKYPEATIKMIDWIYSKEGSLTAMRGVADEDFKYTNADKTECELIIPEGFSNFEEYRAKMLTPNSGSQTPGIGGGTLPVVVNPLNSYIDLQVKENLMPYWKEPYPLTYLPSAAQKEVATISADINNYTLETTARFITGDLSIEKEYDNFISELKKMGVERYVQIYQEAYDSWAAN